MAINLKSLNLKRSRFSFTVIELLVSITIINVIILTAVGIYMLAIGSRQKTISQTTLQQEGQYIMSLIAKDIRSSKVNYSAYGGAISNPTATLALLDLTVTPAANVSYFRELAGSQYFLKKQIGAGPAQAVTANDINVERLDFYIYPTTDPIVHGSTTFENPKVTIVIKLKSLKERPGQSTLTLQQTILQKWLEKK